MSKTLQFSVLAFVAGVCMVLAPIAAAQQDQPGQRGPRGGAQRGDQGPGGPGGFGRGGDRGGRPNFDPEQMRERLMQGFKERLGCSDDEWTVIEPLVTKVMEAQRDARTGGGGFFGRGGGPGGDRGNRGGSASTDELSQARDALRDAIANNGDVEGKLKAYREVKAEKEQELKKAQDELRAVLTQKQEAQLVADGMLD